MIGIFDHGVQRSCGFTDVRRHIAFGRPNNDDFAGWQRTDRRVERYADAVGLQNVTRIHRVAENEVILPIEIAELGRQTIVNRVADRLIFSIDGLAGHIFYHVEFFYDYIPYVALNNGTKRFQGTFIVAVDSQLQQFVGRCFAEHRVRYGIGGEINGEISLGYIALRVRQHFTIFGAKRSRHRSDIAEWIVRVVQIIASVRCDHDQVVEIGIRRLEHVRFRRVVENSPRSVGAAIPKLTHLGPGQAFQRRMRRVVFGTNCGEDHSSVAGLREVTSVARSNENRRFCQGEPAFRPIIFIRNST